MLVDKNKKSCHIIDMAIPESSGVKEKEFEKVKKHRNLAKELRRMWEVKTNMVPVVLGALGTVPLRLKGNLKGHRSRHVNQLNPEVCIAGISKNSKKSIRNVKGRKKK